MVAPAGPRRLRIVDYVANPGGGVRFVRELVGALLSTGHVRVEIVSHGVALDDYRRLFPDDDRLRFRDLPPENLRRTRAFSGFRGAGRLNSLLRLGEFHYDVPASVRDGCDLLWFPWLHRHRLPADHGRAAFASLHDLILLQFPGLVPDRVRRDEHETIRRWVESEARIAASSTVTAETVAALFGCARERVETIPVSGEHAWSGEPARLPAGWTFLGAPYLLCAANVMRHKNHDVLLPGIRAIADAHPLVLTGGGTDFSLIRAGRGDELRRLAETEGFVWGSSLHGLGYVDDASYQELLRGAWAVVVPTLAEGGGSFPALEAMRRGIPVLCSDIPVLREMVARFGGDVIWFDPRDPASLAAAAAELERNYTEIKQAATARVGELRSRSWDDVAADYLRFFETASREDR